MSPRTTGKQKKVLVFFESHQRGGAERYFFDLCNCLPLDGYSVTVFYNSDGDFPKRVMQNIKPPVALKPFPVLTTDGLITSIQHSQMPSIAKTALRALLFPFRYLFYPFNVLLFFNELKCSQPDVLHIINGGYPGAFSCHAAALAGKVASIKKVLFSLLNTPRRRIVPLIDVFLDALTSRSVDFFVPNAHYLGSELVRLRGIPSPKVLTIYTAPPLLQPHYTQRQKDLFRRRNGIAQNEFVICYVAMFELAKGHDILLLAFKNFFEKAKDSKLVLVGAGKTEPRIKKIALDSGVGDAVIFTGYCSRDVVNEWLSIADLFVYPSLGEGLPYSLIEAMQAGKSIIATSVGGMPEFIENEKTGILVSPSNTQELTDAILRLYYDEKKRSRLGANAKNRVQDISLPSMIKKTETLYNDP